MIGLLCFILAIVGLPFKSKLRLEAENAVLRHQLIVLRRRLHGRVRLTNNDRWFFIQPYRWFPSILERTWNSAARTTSFLKELWKFPPSDCEASDGLVPCRRAGAIRRSHRNQEQR